MLTRDAPPEVSPRGTIWLLAGGVGALLVGLFLPLTDGDSALYATIARNALSSGEWIALPFPDGRLLDKPPLTIWLLGLSMRFLGSAEWALRLWHVLLGLAMVAATYALARLVLSRAQSLAAALVLLSMNQFFYQALVPQQDVPLALFLTLAVYWYLLWESSGRHRDLALAGGAVALAFLSKGLLGIALFGLIVGLHVLLHRPRWPARWPVAVAAGVAACLLFLIPWFAAGVARRGWEFLDMFLLGGPLGVGRFFQAVSPSASGSAWFDYFVYLLFLPLGVLPWIGWLWPGLRAGWVDQRRTRLLRSCAVWVLGVIVFLSVSPGDKVLRYQLPVLPPLAVLIAAATGEGRWWRAAAWTSLAAAGVMAAALLWVVRAPLAPDARAYLPLVAAFIPPFAAGMAALAVETFRARRHSGWMILVAMSLAAYVLLVAAAIRQWDQIMPWRPLARVVNTSVPAGVPVLVVGNPTPFPVFYVERGVEFVHGDDVNGRWTAGRVAVMLPAGALSIIPPAAPHVIAGAAAGWLLVTNFTPP